MIPLGRADAALCCASATLGSSRAPAGNDLEERAESGMASRRIRSPMAAKAITSGVIATRCDLQVLLNKILPLQNFSVFSVEITPAA